MPNIALLGRLPIVPNCQTKYISLKMWTPLGMAQAARGFLFMVQLKGFTMVALKYAMKHSNRLLQMLL